MNTQKVANEKKNMNWTELYVENNEIIKVSPLASHEVAQFRQWF